MWITNLAGDIKAGQKESLARTVGYSREELVGKNVAESRPAPQAAGRGRIHRTTDIPGTVTRSRLQKRYRTRYGEALWIDLLVTVIRDADGQMNALIRLVIDITDRIRAERDLRIAAIAFESQEGMTVTNEQGVILRMDGAAKQMAGYSAAEVIGQTPRLLQSRRRVAAFYEQMWDCIVRTTVAR